MGMQPNSGDYSSWDAYPRYNATTLAPSYYQKSHPTNQFNYVSNFNNNPYYNQYAPSDNTQNSLSSGNGGNPVITNDNSVIDQGSGEIEVAEVTDSVSFEREEEPNVVLSNSTLPARNDEISKTSSLLVTDETTNREHPYDLSKTKRNVQRFPCYYCPMLPYNLKEHLFKIHKDAPRVSAIIKLSKPEQKTQIAIIKSEGIHKYNAGKAVEHQIGARKRNNNSSCLVTCSKCFKPMTKRGLRRHSKTCRFEKESLVLTPGATSTLRRKIDTDFCVVINELQDDDIKKIIISSDELLEIGRTILNAKLKQEEKELSARQQTRKFLRDFAKLHKSYQASYGACKFLEMFSSAEGNYLRFSKIFADLSHEADGTPINSRVVRYYNAMKHLEDGACLYYNKRGLCSQAVDVKIFRASFGKDYAGEFGRALAAYKRTAAEKRKYKALPELSDINTLLNFCGKKLMECDYTIVDEGNQEKICRYLLILGTISNSRRGGEVSRLRISKAKEGLAGDWMPPQCIIEQMPDEQTNMMRQYLHFLVAGKKANTEVDFIIHTDFRPAFEFLVSEENRKKLGINSGNTFVFTNKRCKGSLPVHQRFVEVCEEAGLAEKLNATDMRHYASTYLTADMTDEERETFFKFMGHSKEISKNVYSCRPVLQTMTLLSKIQSSLNMGHNIHNAGTSQMSLVKSPPHAKIPSEKVRPKPCTPNRPKISAKRKYNVGSDSDWSEEEELESANKKTNTHKRVKWDPVDNEDINCFFSRFVLPGGVKSAPSSDVVKNFLSTNSCSKSLGKNASFNFAKTMIVRKVHNNRRILCEKRSRANK